MYVCQKMPSTHIHKQQSLDISKNPTLNLCCTIYNSHMPKTKTLLSNIVQLLCKLIHVNNLLYTYVNKCNKKTTHHVHVFSQYHMQQTLRLDLILKNLNTFQQKCEHI